MTSVKDKLLAGSVSGLCLLLVSCGGGTSDENQSTASSKSEEGAAGVDDTTTASDAAPAETSAAEPEAAADEVIALIDFTGDAAGGKRVFLKCMACHGAAEGQHKIGPSLYNIVGAKAGVADGFKYSATMANSDVVWTEDELFAYLGKPAVYMPGNRMIFPGLPSGQQRADVITYLKSTSE